MAKAISLVMLETYHRLCLWHIYQNALKNLNRLFRSQKTFNVDFRGAYMMVSMNRSSLVLGRICWKNMIFKKIMVARSILSARKVGYGVWEKYIFYGRNTFSMGKKSTQLSESFNSLLKDYLKSDLDISTIF